MDAAVCHSVKFIGHFHAFVSCAETCLTQPQGRRLQHAAFVLAIRGFDDIMQIRLYVGVICLPPQVSKLGVFWVHEQLMTVSAQIFLNPIGSYFPLTATYASSCVFANMFDAPTGRSAHKIGKSATWPCNGHSVDTCRLAVFTVNWLTRCIFIFTPSTIFHRFTVLSQRTVATIAGHWQHRPTVIADNREDVYTWIHQTLVKKNYKCLDTWLHVS